MALSAQSVNVRFGGVRAVTDVSLRLDQGEILGLVGPNGAGKTTLVNVLSGFQRPAEGDVQIDGQSVRAQPPHWFPANGVVRTFQSVRLFMGLTVSENIEAALTVAGYSRRSARAKAGDLLDYLGLAERRDTIASALNYSDERRVGIARALALNPRFLLMDEPAAGMNAAEVDELGVLIHAIRKDFGCGVLVIEHNMRLISDLCERLHVIVQGATLAVGAPEDIWGLPEFRSAYLGATS
ncbi:ABC transporter ATP-binding protein [Shimia sediminis]|uniref:ABC transporter ATP-binding protein n=1 Tax=Shimia sediminis TaxID=2497945 RepID=UPI000F8F0989|nr:ABC transporter ATP-binding protein [Shimia sediminis]